MSTVDSSSVLYATEPDPRSRVPVGDKPRVAGRALRSPQRLQGTGLRIFLSVSRTVQALAGIVQLSVVAKSLPATEFAFVATVLAVSAYLQLLAEPAVLGYQRLGHHHRVHDSEELPRRSAQTLFWVFAIAIPGSLFCWGIITGQPLLAVAAAAWVLSQVQLRWVSIQYLNWNDQYRFGVTTLLNSVSRAAFMIGAAITVGSGSAVLLAGGLASLATTALIGPNRPHGHAPFSGLIRVLKVGAPLAVASAAITSLSNWPILAGARALPHQEFASYAAQTSLAVAAYGVTISYILVFGFPQAKRAWDTGHIQMADSVVLRYSRYVVALGSLLAIAWWLFGAPLTGVLLGEEYTGRVVGTAAILAGMAASLSTIAGWRLNLAFRQRYIATVMVITALVQIPLLPVLLDRLGLPGLLAGAGLIWVLAGVVMVTAANGPRRPVPLGALSLIAFALIAVSAQAG